jgi:PKD repeat protein
MNRAFYIVCCVLLLLGSGHSFAQNRAVSLHLSSSNDRGVVGDIITKTILVPEGFTPTYTYYSAMGWWGTGGEGDGYCGIQQHPSGRNFIFSLWDPEATDEAITAAYQGHGTMVERFGGEGTGLKSWNFNLGWESDTWYRMLGRLWDYNGHTYFGYWVENQASGEWYHLITMDYPIEGVRINSGINSFLEDWYGNGWEARRYHIKDGYKRNIQGEWIPMLRCVFSVNQEASTANYNDNYDGGVIDNDYFFMQSGGSTEASCGTQEVFTITEDPLPVWDTIKIAQAKATYDAVERDLELTWKANPASGPQFAWYAAIFDNPECSGSAAMELGDTIPQQEEEIVDLSSLPDGTWYVRLFLRDVFDALSDTSILSFTSNTETHIPEAEFFTEQNDIYQYSFVEFTETSTGLPSSWEWTFEGAEPAGSTNRFPLVAFGETGSFDVQLIARNDLGADTLLKSDYIHVAPAEDQALDLRGTMGDYVELPPMDYQSEQFTFECWIRIEEKQDPSAAIFFNRSGKACGLNFRENNELGYHWLDRSSNWSSGLHVPLNEWCHVALVVEADRATIYLNGAQSTNITTHETANFDGPSKLGADKDYEDNFSGLIDQIRIWGGARSAAEILDNRYKDLDAGNETDLLALYECNQKETSGLYDLANGRHGLFHALQKDRWVASFPKVNEQRSPEAAFGASTDVIEINSTVVFFDASSFEPETWHWYFEGGSPAESLDRFPEVIYEAPGSFNVKLVISNTEGSDSLEIPDLIQVQNPPAPIAIFGASKTRLSLGESISMNNLSKNDPTDYDWYFEGGDPENSTEKNPLVTYEKPGVFDISLIALNPYGADTLLLEDYIQVSSALGMEEEQLEADIRITDNEIHLHLNDPGTCRASLWNMSGQLLLSEEVNSSTVLSLTENKPGVFILQIINTNQILTKKIYLN